MQSNMQIPYITYFSVISKEPDADYGPMKVYAETAQEAIDSCSNPEKWKVEGEPVKCELIHCPAIAEIMRHVPGEWEFESIKGRRIEFNTYVPGVIRKSDGMELYFNSPDRYGNKGKWEISLCFDYKLAPIYNDKMEKLATPSIKASASKTPEKIAADIIRRLIPECEVFQAAYLAKKERQNNFEASQMNTLKTISSALGVPIRTRHSSVETQFSGYSIPTKGGSYASGYGYFDISGAKVDFKLHSLSLEKAERIAKLPKGIR